MIKLNIGCGSIFHSEWINIDYYPAADAVKRHDIRKGLPYGDAYFDVCYSSHMLEHLTCAEAEAMIREIKRVLRPGGIVRIAVPDLESIVREYLSALEEVLQGKFEREADYDWMMRELLDQLVRSYSGGEMGEYLRNPDLKNKGFVLSRFGKEAEGVWEGNESINKESFLHRLNSVNVFTALKRIRFLLAQGIVRTVAGREAVKAFEEGWFRNSGEVHRWMYDRFSLGRLLSSAGFVNAVVCRAGESRIPDFESYHLEVLDGVVRKPDSLFIEAVKP